MPLIKSHTAGLAARAVTDEVVSLADIAYPLENGAFYPLFLLILQRIAKAKSKDGLVVLFNESKVVMLKMLPESDRNKERMMEILEGKVTNSSNIPRYSSLVEQDLQGGVS